MENDSFHGAALQLRNLTKRYGEVEVLHDVSLDIRPGEFLTFLGPSGSGKTTTLNLIAGFQNPSDGEILLDGDDLSSRPPYKRDIGVVFQNYALFPHMTAAQNVAFPLEERGTPRAEITARVAEVLDAVGLGALGNRRPRELSGGQQQRVAVARALVFRPRVVLMDEPLGALDKKMRETLQLEIKRLHRELGITFIYVTHDQEEALVLSDRIAVFNNGTIVQLGTPSELYDRPDSFFVADFLGQTNVLAGVVDGDGRITGPGFSVPAGSSVRPGDDVFAFIRPERLRLLLSGEPVLEDHVTIEGDVVEDVYLGSERRLIVETTGGPRLSCRVEAHHAAPAIGERARLSWPVSGQRILPRTAELVSS